MLQAICRLVFSRSRPGWSRTAACDFLQEAVHGRHRTMAIRQRHDPVALSERTVCSPGSGIEGGRLVTRDERSKPASSMASITRSISPTSRHLHVNGWPRNHLMVCRGTGIHRNHRLKQQARVAEHQLTVDGYRQKNIIAIAIGEASLLWWSPRGRQPRVARLWRAQVRRTLRPDGPEAINGLENPPTSAFSPGRGPEPAQP